MSAMRRRMSVIRAGLDVMMMFSIYVLCVVCPAVCSGGAVLSVFGIGCQAVEELLRVEEQLRVAVGGRSCCNCVWPGLAQAHRRRV